MAKEEGSKADNALRSTPDAGFTGRLGFLISGKTKFRAGEVGIFARDKSGIL